MNVILRRCLIYPAVFSCFFVFKYSCACTIAEDHAVTIILVNDSRQCFRANDQCFPGDTSFEIRISLYNTLHPSRAAK